LKNYVNLGNFEGSAGANKSIVMKLTLAQDLLLICFGAKMKDQPMLAIDNLQAQIETNTSLREEY
jgi:hypothetical protein